MCDFKLRDDTASNVHMLQRRTLLSSAFSDGGGGVGAEERLGLWGKEEEEEEEGVWQEFRCSSISDMLSHIKLHFQHTIF